MSLDNKISATQPVTANVTWGFAAGTDSSAVAGREFAPALTSGTAAQLSTQTDVMLYIGVKTASTVAIAIGPTSTPAITVFTSETAPLALYTVLVPKGWYVSATFTSADVTLVGVPC